MKFKKGFTLIELLVVISIISLLSSVVIASVSSARESARDAERILAIKQIQNALELYASDHGGSYPGYLAGENTYMRSSNGATEGDPESCGYGAPGSAGDQNPNYVPGIWCRLETALAPYISKLPRTYLKSGVYYGYTYKVPANSSSLNPNNIRYYGLGVKLERQNSTSQNDGGYQADMFEVGQLPAYCLTRTQANGKNWTAWAGTPCSCGVQADYATGGASCGL